MLDTKHEAIDTIVNNLVMAGQLEQHYIATYMEYLSGLSNHDLGQAIVESRVILDKYYRTKFSEN